MVKFHWDLSDTKDDAVSCWVRVAQSWADKNWGAFFIPRVGQEVIITFLNGDPDQPLVIGCVYNATNMPPYGPDMAIKSGFKTNSSKGGGGFNELHFDDTKGSENFFMQAQTDMTTMILDGQRTTTIKGTKSKGHDILTIVEGKRDTTLSKGDDFLTLAAGSRTTKISDDLNLTIGKNATIKVGKDGTVTVDGSLTLNITKDLIINADNIKTLGKTLTDFKGPTIKIEADTLVDIKGATAKLTGAGGVTIAGGMIALTGGMIKLG